MNDKESVVKMNDKLDTRSLDVEDVEKQKLKSVFPQCFEEGKLNVERLLTLCGKYSDEKDHEKYNFEWKGKQQAYQLAAKRTMATLRPCKEESVNFDETGNLYIEGDNLEVIKVLQKSYYNKIKMIYIDPPYNTGHDFVYNDDFKDPLDRYKEITSQTTKSNPESMGRFHTAWLNMMLPRLRLAANLLREDGVIFISIDDHELHNLRKICDEVFGEENFVALCPRKTRSSATTKSDAEIQKLNDYILVYWKNKFNSAFNLKFVGEKQYPYTDERGKYYIVQLQDNGPQGTRTARPNLYYPIYQDSLGNLSLERTNSTDTELLPTRHKNDDGRWMWSKEKFQKDSRDLCVKNGKVYIKHYFNPSEDQSRYQHEKNWFNQFEDQIMNRQWFETYMNSKGTVSLSNTVDEKGVFDNPKPIDLLKLLINMSTNKDDIILDFFSGSATTAHAVMELNKEDGGNRKFIMVQLPEICDKDSIAFKKGCGNICEIGKKRIRCAGQKLLEKDNQMSFEENKKPLDVGFKVFKLDSSNLKAWDSSPIDKETYDNYEQLKIEMTKRFDKVLDRIKSDRTDLDVVYEIMFKLGIEPTEKITKMDFDGKTVYSVREDCLLLICLDNDMKTETVEKMAEFSPAYMVFSQHCFKDVSSMSNIKLLLKRKKIDMKFI